MGQCLLVRNLHFLLKPMAWNTSNLHSLTLQPTCAERAVRTFKTAMKKLKDIESMSDRLQIILFQYCIIPQSITGKSPAELLMNRKFINKLNIIKPDDDISKVNHSRKCQSFETDEEVWAPNFHLGEKWIPGSIVAVTGPVSYQVSTEIGLLWKHVNHSRNRKNTDPLIKYDFVVPPPRNSTDKAMNEFEGHECLISSCVRTKFSPWCPVKIHPGTDLGPIWQ